MDETGFSIVGNGRLGRSLCAALRARGIAVADPIGRDQPLPHRGTVLLCVRDAEIEPLAAQLSESLVLGHCSGANGPELLRQASAFVFHPLMTFSETRSDLEGVPVAISATDRPAEEAANWLAQALGMEPFAVTDETRLGYHTAACLAANLIVPVLSAAGEVADGAGVERARYLPLIQATVDNWARIGDRALTGPVARGDHETVQRQRALLKSNYPHLEELFERLVAESERIRTG